MKDMCPFKQYSDLFGLAGQGVHKHTLFKVIVIDNLMTIALAMILTYQFDVPFPLSIIGIYTISILVHMLFGVQTDTLTYLGIRCH